MSTRGVDERYPVPPQAAEGSQHGAATMSQYRALQAQVSNDPDAFWLEETRRRLSWRTAPTVGLEGSYRSVRDGPFRWFADGRLNVVESCVDRHAAASPERAALIWEADEPGEGRQVSYGELHELVCRALR